MQAKSIMILWICLPKKFGGNDPIWLKKWLPSNWLILISATKRQQAKSHKWKRMTQCQNRGQNQCTSGYQHGILLMECTSSVTPSNITGRCKHTAYCKKKQVSASDVFRWCRSVLETLKMSKMCNRFCHAWQLDYQTMRMMLNARI